MPYSVTPSCHALYSTQTMHLKISRLLYVICHSIRQPTHVFLLWGILPIVCHEKVHVDPNQVLTRRSVPGHPRHPLFWCAWLRVVHLCLVTGIFFIPPPRLPYHPHLTQHLLHPIFEPQLGTPWMPQCFCIFLGQLAFDFGSSGVYGSTSMRQFHRHLKIQNSINFEVLLAVLANIHDARQMDFTDYRDVLYFVQTSNYSNINMWNN